MNVAMFFQLRCLDTFQTWLRQMVKGFSRQAATKSIVPCAYSERSSSALFPRSRLGGATPERAGPTALSMRPLRVVQVREAGQSSNCVGRMVISGSMAAVCAELDRLAAREAGV